MDPTESLRAYASDTNQNVQTHDHRYNNSMITSDSYNFMTGTGVIDVPLKDQVSQLQGPPISEEGGGSAQDPSGPRPIGTLYTNQHPPSSGDYPNRSPSVPNSNWDNMHGASLYSNSNMQNILIGGGEMMAAPGNIVTAQLLIGGLQGASFNDGGHSDHGNVYYTSAANNQQEPMTQALYYANAAAYNSNAGYHSDGRDPAGVTALLYATQDEGTATPQPSCDQSQQQFRVDPFQAAAAGVIPLSLHEHSASHNANQNYNWRNGGNEHSFLPMNEESQNHQSQFDTDHHVPQFNVSRAHCHDLSHMQPVDHMSTGVGLHMESLKGISVNGQGLSLSLSSHQSHFHSVGGQLPEADQMAAIGQAAAIAKTKELASRYLTGGSTDLSRFRIPSTDDALVGARFLQDHMDRTGQKHFASSSHSGPSGAGSSNHISASRFLGCAQAILNEVCRVTAVKRHPKPARSSDHQHQNWNKVPAGGSSASVDGNYTYNGKEDLARSSILTEVDSGRHPASAFNIHTSPLVTVSHIPLESEMIQGLADAARTQNRDDLESKKQKLGLMLDEVEARYRRYCDQLQNLITGFNSQAGPNTATPYTILALQAMSRHFRCLRDAIGNQLKIVRRALGEDVDRNTGVGETSRLRYVDQQIRQQRALQQLGMLQQHAWRPQRGLPERAVSVLRAWLFEHFLHPYPKDVDKLNLAKQTGLTRSQVSNWFINARVRLWKPMVEEMYVEEQKENDERLAAERVARDQAEIENTYEQYEGDRGNSGLLHEVSANAQASRIQNGNVKRNEDRENIENGPGVVTEVGGTSAEGHSHPLIPVGQRLDIDVTGNYNEDGREAKKARSNSTSDGFKPNASMIHPGMNIEGGKSAQEGLNFEGEDVQVEDGTDFETQNQVSDQNNQHLNGYMHVSQPGTATVDIHIQPNVVGAGAFKAFNDSHNIGHRSYENRETELRVYASRAAVATSAGTVSLTLGLRHSEVNQHRYSMVSPTVDVSKPYNMDTNDQINQLNRVETYEGRTGDIVSHNGQSTSTAMSNGHYLQPAEDNSNITTNSNNSNDQQLSPPREFNATN